MPSKVDVVSLKLFLRNNENEGSKQVSKMQLRLGWCPLREQKESPIYERDWIQNEEKIIAGLPQGK